MFDEPVLYLIGMLVVWPATGALVAVFRRDDRRQASRPMLWAATAGGLTATVLITVATAADPTTPSEGMRGLGIGLLGVASAAGALLSLVAAAALRGWPSKTDPNAG